MIRYKNGKIGGTLVEIFGLIILIYVMFMMFRALGIF